MPFKSDAQRKAMYAAASGRGNIGIKPSAARKFIEHSGGEAPKQENKMADSKNLLLKLLPGGSVRDAGGKAAWRVKYNRFASIRAEKGAPKLPPFEQWPPYVAWQASQK